MKSACQILKETIHTTAWGGQYFTWTKRWERTISTWWTDSNTSREREDWIKIWKEERSENNLAMHGVMASDISAMVQC